MAYGCLLKRKKKQTSCSLTSRSWLGMPISSNSPCSWPIFSLTCWARKLESMAAKDSNAASNK